ncbi:MAG: hypothetical protein AB1779_10255 [Candidatus Thermoplasmatota archaeon]
MKENMCENVKIALLNKKLMKLGEYLYCKYGGRTVSYMGELNGYEFI